VRISKLSEVPTGLYVGWYSFLKNYNNPKTQNIIMKKYLFTLSAFAMLASCSPKKKTVVFQVIQNEKTEKLDSLYAEHYRKGEFNGNVLVAENGKIIFQESYGLANEETKEPLNIETAFELASVSKQFTAMGIVQLQKEGKLSYSDVISKYIPELSNYEAITIRNLLGHTGGLPDYMMIMEKNWDKTKFATNESVIKLFQELQPEIDFEPGEKFRYSNTGYLLLGTIIERVSGQSFEDYLTEKIFAPLEMERTFIYRRRYQPKQIRNYARGYMYSDSLKRKILPDEKGKDFYCVYLDGIVGDGMVNSTLQDLFKWDRALYENTLVNEEDKKLIFSSHQTKDGKDTGYGYGWFIQQDSLYGKVVSHSGGWAGYTTFIERQPDKDKTIILLQNNRTKLTKLPLKNTRKILYEQPVEAPYSLDKDVLLKYIGDYDSGTGTIEKIVYEFDRLWSNTRYELKPVSETKFKLIGFSPTVTFEFILDKSGNAEKLRIQQLKTGVDETAIRKK